MKFVNTVEIERPVSEVFAFLSDLENQPRWNYFVIGCTKQDGGPIRVGSTYKQVRKTDSQVLKVTGLERDRRMTLRLMAPTPPLEIRYGFEADGPRTRLTDEWELDGVAGFFANLAGAPTKAAVAENLGKLKELLETGVTRLQDGRTERYVFPASK